MNTDKKKGKVHVRVSVKTQMNIQRFTSDEKEVVQ